MPLPITVGQLVLKVLPQVLERTAHDDEILPDPGLVAHMFGNQKLFVKAEAFENPVGTGLRTHQPRDDLVDPMLGSDVKELAGHDGPETEPLPGMGNDEPNFGHVVAPPVSLELERAVGCDFALVDCHDADNSTTIMFLRPMLHQFPPGDVGSKVFPVLRRQCAEELIRVLNIVKAHSSHGDLAPVFESNRLSGRFLSAWHG